MRVSILQPAKGGASLTRLFRSLERAVLWQRMTASAMGRSLHMGLVSVSLNAVPGTEARPFSHRVCMSCHGSQRCATRRTPTDPASGCMWEGHRPVGLPAGCECQARIKLRRASLCALLSPYPLTCRLFVSPEDAAALLAARPSSRPPGGHTRGALLHATCRSQARFKLVNGWKDHRALPARLAAEIACPGVLAALIGRF
jgi:hypothetical protein